MTKRRKIENDRDPQAWFWVFFTVLVLLIAHGLAPPRFNPLGIFRNQVDRPHNESRRGGVLDSGHPDDSFRGGVLDNVNQWYMGEVEEGSHSYMYGYYEEFYSYPVAVQVTPYEQFEGEHNWQSYLYYQETPAIPEEIQQTQELEPLLLQFVTTSPIVHYMMDPIVAVDIDIEPVDIPVEIPRCFMIIHGLWELDNGTMERFSDGDYKWINNRSLISQLENAWPSLSDPSKPGCQTFCSHEWYEHGGRIPLFETKIEYVTEGLHLYHDFDVTRVLSDIKQRLEAEDLLWRDTREGVTWYGVYSQRFYDYLVEAFHGRGIQFISYYQDIIEDGDKVRYYRLRSLKLYLQYDWGSGTFSVVNDEALLERSLSWVGVRWKGKILPEEEDVIIWFVTPDSENE